MQRAALVITLMLVACGEDDGTGMLPDAAPDAATGSGSGVAMASDPNPPDVTLEWIVIGLSVVVVGGSVRSRRRAAKTFEL